MHKIQYLNIWYVQRTRTHIFKKSSVQGSLTEF